MQPANQLKAALNYVPGVHANGDMIVNALYGNEREAPSVCNRVQRIAWLREVLFGNSSNSSTGGSPTAQRAADLVADPIRRG